MGKYYYTAIHSTFYYVNSSSMAAAVMGSLITDQGNGRIDLEGVTLMHYSPPS